VWSNRIKEDTDIGQNTLEDADQTTQEKIVSFVSKVPENDRPAIPTGLIVAGPSIASHGSFFARLGERIREQNDSTYLVLTSGESPNLKTLLKNLIRKATSRVEDDDDDDIALTRPSRNGPKLLDFDLGHLQEWQARNPVRNVVVAIQDSEAFDARVLDEMIDLFNSWLDRLPFILLFGIATSAESVEDRLSGKTLRYLEGRKFDVTQSDEIIEKLFSATIASADLPLRIGPNIARRIMDRQKDHVQNTQDFSDGLKYAYMSLLYASYPSIFLKAGITFGDVGSDAFEAVRNLPSFRRYVPPFHLLYTC
jgi:origin recognition complex subunit 3